ncbi:MAG: hypothetical protein MUD12_08765 [Spirochaetes bacterium]|nr:hypothetical protein [Spirochaetota bacterium]
MIVNIITKNSTLPLILFKPAFEVYRTYTLVNSNEPLERLSGYYSMLDNNIINSDFLYDRLQKEKHDFIKRNIIWIMGQSDDLGATIRIYSSVYSSSEPAVRKEILSSLRKKGKGIYDEFIKNNKIKNVK